MVQFQKSVLKASNLYTLYTWTKSQKWETKKNHIDEKKILNTSTFITKLKLKTFRCDLIAKAIKGYTEDEEEIRPRAVPQLFPFKTFLRYFLIPGHRIVISAQKECIQMCIHTHLCLRGGCMYVWHFKPVIQ